MSAHAITTAHPEVASPELLEKLAGGQLSLEEANQLLDVIELMSSDPHFYEVDLLHRLHKGLASLITSPHTADASWGTALVELIRHNPNPVYATPLSQVLLTWLEREDTSIEELRASLEGLLDLRAIDAPTRLEIAWSVEAHDRLPELMASAKLPIETFLAHHERALTLDPSKPGTLALLEVMYLKGPWLGRRPALRSLSGLERAPLVPLLARIVRHADPMTRLSVFEALARIGHISAEPVLLHALARADREEEVLAILEALKMCGTHLALGPLHASMEHQPPALEPMHLDVIQHIQRMYPVAEGSQGGLTLAGGGPRGALSLMGAGEGDVALYEQTSQALARVEAPGEGAMILHQDNFQRLRPGPRALPLAFQITSWLLLKPYVHQTMVWAGWMLAAAMGLLLFIDTEFAAISVSFGLWMLLWPLFLLLVGGHVRARNRLLQRAYPTYAELESYEAHQHRNGTSHKYTLVATNDEGAIYRVERVFADRRPEIEDNALERAFFSVEETQGANELLTFDEVGWLSVNDDGDFEAEWSPALAASFLALIALVTWSIHLVRFVVYLSSG